MSADRVDNPPQVDLQGLLDRLAQRYGVPGAALAVYRDGERQVATAGVLDMSRSEAVAIDSQFALGSVTKLYTATMVMQLIDEGRVDLDAPIGVYVPELQLPDPEAKWTVTPRHLLSHTSGLEGELTADFGEDDDAVERFVRAADSFTQIAGPGEVFSYWDAGFVVLGRLVERLREMPWRMCLERHLLSLLGASRTTATRTQLMPPFARGHLPHPDGSKVMIAPAWTVPAAQLPSGGVWASVLDLLALGEMMVCDGRARSGRSVLRRESVTAMRSPQATFPGNGAWGLGWTVQSVDRRLIGHGGFFMGQLAAIHAVPDRRCVVAFLANANGGLPLERELFHHLFETSLGVHTVEPPRPTPGTTISAPERYVGVYQRPEYELVVEWNGATLALMGRNLARARTQWPEFSPIPMRPCDDSVFLLSRTESAVPYVFGDQDDDVPVHFLRIEDGAARYLHFAGRIHRRSSSPRPTEG